MLMRIHLGWKKFEAFWFGADESLNLRVLQIFWAVLVLRDIDFLWVPSLGTIFAAGGIFRAVTDPQYLRWWNIFSYSDGEVTLKISLAILIASLTFVILGYRRWRSAILSFYLLACFHHLSPQIFFPSSSFLRFAGFVLIFSCGSYATVSNRWILRLIQVQFSVIYLLALLEKIQSPYWLTGEASLFALQLDSATPFLKEFMTEYTSWRFVFRLLSWSALAVEIFSVLGLWFPRSRKAALATGAVYHLSALVLFGDNIFQPLMFFGLTTFIKWDAVVANARVFFGQLFHRSRTWVHREPQKKAG